MPFTPREKPEEPAPKVPAYIQKGFPILCANGRMGLVTAINESSITAETSEGYEYIDFDAIYDAGHGALRQEGSTTRPFMGMDLYNLVLAIGWAKRHYDL